MLKERVHFSTVVLVSIGLFDLVTSLAWLNQGFAEGNPLFAWFAQRGAWAFAAAKILFLAGPVLILEFARQRHPRSAEQGTWIAAAFYALLYTLNLLKLNGSP